MIWKKEFNTGIHEIDHQHQELVKIVSRLQGSLSSDTKYSEIGPTLKFLVNYTHEHFDAEEKIMSQINYPDFQIHQQHHKKLIDEINGILIKLKNRQAFTPIELYYLLTNWLMEHILNEDIKISIYYYNKVGKKMPSHLGTGTIEKIDKTENSNDRESKPLIASTIIQIYSQSAKEGKDSKEVELECINKITKYFLENPVHILKEFKNIFSSLDAMKDSSQIGEESIKKFKSAIYSKLDLRSSLDKAESIDNRLRYIKFLFEQGLIDEKEYENLKIEEVKSF